MLKSNQESCKPIAVLQKCQQCDICLFISIGLPRDHPESYHSFMYNNFFKHIDIQPENANILDGNAKDIKQECEDFEKKIVDAGGIQLFVGGRVK